MAKYEQSLLSKYELREIGWNEGEGDFVISEEERANHIHILGTTREGKSKFMETLIRQDIDNGYGGTLIDGSAKGETAYAILRYCCEIGYNNVVWIDLNDHHTLPTINPLHYWGSNPDSRKYHADAIVAKVMDSTRNLWGQTDVFSTGKIQTYLTAMLKAIYIAGGTLPDTKYFMAMSDARRNNKVLNKLEDRRRVILNKSDEFSDHRITLEEVFNSRAMHLNEFKTSARRMQVVHGDIPSLVYGSTETPINFAELVSRKAFILVNLNLSRTGGPDLEKLIGTTIVNEIITAVKYLSDSPASTWQGRHYLYLDEAWKSATRQLSNIMSLMGKEGLWVTVAHQYDTQFEDKVVLDAIYNACKIDVMFRVPDPQSRKRMAERLFWGEGQNSEAILSTMKKQEAIVKVDKRKPELIRINNIPEPFIDGETLGRYKEVIYNSWPFYRKPSEIAAELENRFASPTVQPKPDGRAKKTADTGSPERRAADDNRTTGGVEPVQKGRKRIKTAFTQSTGEGKDGGIQPSGQNPPATPKE